MKYWTCPYCKSNLDFGEQCNCNLKGKIAISDCDSNKQKNNICDCNGGALHRNNKNTKKEI